MVETQKYTVAWLAKFYDDVKAATPARTALIGAEDQDEAVQVAGSLMREHMRVDVVAVALKPSAGVPLGEVRWLD